MSASSKQEEFLKKSLKRLLEEIHNAQQRNDYLAWHGLIQSLIDVQKLAKSLHPNNEVLQSLPNEKPHTFDNFHYASPNMASLKMRVLNIIDAIGWDFSEINKITSSTPMFNITQTQNTFQYNIQSIDNILSNLNRIEIDAQVKVELEGLIKEFGSETQKGEPDKNKLWEVIKKAGSLSKDIGFMLLQYALDKGLLQWVGFPS